MRRPDLFIVGAPKCGTTALYAYLRRHPEIFMSPLKEPHFFGSDLVFADRPPLSEQEYLGFFAGFLLYISAADILPEAHSRHRSAWTLVMTAVGAAFIFFAIRGAE